MSDDGEEASPPTADKAYADRLNELQGKRWKKVLHVQAPWKAHMRHLALGRVLDVGSGNGRNLHYLDKGSVGVDHNAFSIEAARKSGVEAYTVDEFFADPTLAAPASFDALLAAHLIEHLHEKESHEILRSYLPMIRPGGRVVLITPQERGFASDATHVRFSDFAVLDALTKELGLEPVKQYSFPFPRFAGKPFIYNEFVHITRVPR